MEQLLWPPFIDSIYMRHMPESVNGYMWDGQTWELYRKMQLFYQYRQFTGLENQRCLSECLWPNPFGDVLHVDGKGYGLLELTDINGRRVMVASLHLPAVVNTSSLPSGVYVYRLQVGGTTRAGKLIRH
ncbi:MAG: Secretion system C-terminal sorting domain [Bacteroidales bacterium]|nr:Secretion system C-terminal sorting domain [Bacteroidales bacterium]MDN5330401.1 Secretion system C-terminal sorting domain [Bacteroidales bacterium]